MTTEKSHSDIDKIKASALNLLTRREHSRLELQRKLRARFDEHDLIETVLDQLTEADWLSETRFVKAYIFSRASRGFGPLHIRQALLQRGVDAELIEQFLFSLPEIDWQERACYVRAKKFGKAWPTRYVDKIKQIKFLQYRGFDKELIVENKVE